MIRHVGLDDMIDQVDCLGCDAGDHCSDTRPRHPGSQVSVPSQPQTNRDASHRREHHQRSAEIRQDGQHDEATGDDHAKSYPTPHWSASEIVTLGF